MKVSMTLKRAMNEIDDINSTPEGRMMLMKMGCKPPHYFGLLSHTLEQLDETERAYIEKYSLEKNYKLLIH